MGQVPDTNTFSLQDVCIAIYGNYSAGMNLVQCFTDATGTFDSRYQPNSYGSKNNMLNFRNYQHVVKTYNYINSDIFVVSTNYYGLSFVSGYDTNSTLTLYVSVSTFLNSVETIHSITLTIQSDHNQSDFSYFTSDQLIVVNSCIIVPSEDSLYYYNYNG